MGGGKNGDCLFIFDRLWTGCYRWGNNDSIYEFPAFWDFLGGLFNFHHRTVGMLFFTNRLYINGNCTFSIPSQYVNFSQIEYFFA